MKDVRKGIHPLYNFWKYRWMLKKSKQPNRVVKVHSTDGWETEQAFGGQYYPNHWVRTVSNDQRPFYYRLDEASQLYTVLDNLNRDTGMQIFWDEHHRRAITPTSD